MKKAATGMFLLLALAGPLAADPPKVKLPADGIPQPVNGYVRFTPETDAVSVVYVGLDGAYPLPTELLKDGKQFALPVAGMVPYTKSYRFVGVAASKTGEQTPFEFSVTIGTGPDPDPNPVPPNPNPPAPTPSDPLVKTFQTAFGESAAEADRNERLRGLILAMTEAAEVHTGDSAILDNQAFAVKVSGRTKEWVGGSLMPLRRAIGKHLNAALPATKVTFDAATRAKFKAEYEKVVAALKGVK